MEKRRQHPLRRRYRMPSDEESVEGPNIDAKWPINKTQFQELFFPPLSTKFFQIGKFIQSPELHQPVDFTTNDICNILQHWPNSSQAARDLKMSLSRHASFTVGPPGMQAVTSFWLIVYFLCFSSDVLGVLQYHSFKLFASWRTNLLGLKYETVFFSTLFRSIVSQQRFIDMDWKKCVYKPQIILLLIIK